MTKQIKTAPAAFDVDAIVKAGRAEQSLRGKHADAAKALLEALEGQGVTFKATFAPKPGENHGPVYDGLMAAALRIITVDGKYLSPKALKACEDDSVAGKALLIGTDTETGRTKKYLRQQAGRWISRHVRGMLKPRGGNGSRSTWLTKETKDLVSAYRRLDADDVPGSVEIDAVKEAMRRVFTLLNIQVPTVDK